MNVRDHGAVGDGATDDSGAIQDAIDAASDAGGGTVYLPPGNYACSSSLTPRSNVTLSGDAGSALHHTAVSAIIYGSAVAFTDFAVEGLTFLGPVDESPATPKRGRTASGPGAQTAVFLTGDLDTTGSGQARLTNFTMRDCAVRNMTALPIRIGGVRGKVSVTGCEFTNNQDAGFLFCEEVIFQGNHVRQSADNGVSLSRGNGKISCVGNTFENCAFNGIWVAGFLTDKGPANFTVTGNVVRDVGHNGIYVDYASKYGAITGNEIDCGLFRGPSDRPSDVNGAGIYLGGFPITDRGNPTDRAEGITVVGNHIRRAARAGVYLNGVRHVQVTGNQISDVGTAHLADGTTVIESGDLTQNIGILMENPVTSADVTVALNSVVDTRATPYTNQGLVPQSASAVNAHLNTVTGTRQAGNPLETGPTRTWQAAHHFNGDIRLNAHVIGGGTAVTVAAGAQSASAAAGSNGAKDNAGVINTTAAASPAAGTIARVTYATAYGAIPKVVLTARNAAAAAVGLYVTSESVAGFSVATAMVPGAGAALSFAYHVMG
ncbi:right-handed parallel beta-helix repeat-containing protein [Streptomyces sp. NBC_01352]|uniref:right-handed parallel beta-helix repeat-containing protein n=1 Tax=Streptomyces sp. NBC_01352 TaxID=2903834 RepID=UPI002E35B6C3|nr:glycosyl hydrolase family 28-related protein [Streptomyces sp. NBC_01352]